MNENTDSLSDDEAFVQQIIQGARRIQPDALFQNIYRTRFPLYFAMLHQLCQRTWPVVHVHKLKVRVTGVAGDGAPVFCILHAMDDGPVPARRFAEATTMIA